MHNDHESFSRNRISTELAIPPVLLAADCFRMGKATNQFQRFCRPESPVSLSSSESSKGTYNSISVTETTGTEEPGPCSHAELTVHKVCDDDEDEDAYICKINANDHYRLCEARAAHDSLLSIPGTLAKRTLSATAAPYLRTPVLTAKLDDVAKVVDLDIPIILPEQLKDLVLSVVHSWIEEGISPDLRIPEIRQAKGLLRYCQEINRLLIEEHGQILCYDEPSDT